jgi:imidazolonepropionase-like amidohydrolase
VVLRTYAWWNDPETRANARIEYLPVAIRQFWVKSPFTRLMDSIPPAAAAAQHKTFDLELEIVGRMHRAGVGILAGTDSGIPYVVQGFSLHDELHWLVKAGLTPMEALRSATLRPAEYFGITGSAGAIARGKFADLVLLNADPLQDIANTRKIEAVMAAGHYLARADLDRMLQKLKADAGTPEQK